MTDEEFNKYCAEVMGFTFSKEIIPDEGLAIGLTHVNGGIKYRTYSPATDLNQMAEVFDKLWPDSMEERSSLITDINEEFFLENLACKGIAQAMREFIESTKGGSE